MNSRVKTTIPILRPSETQGLRPSIQMARVQLRKIGITLAVSIFTATALIATTSSSAWASDTCLDVFNGSVTQSSAQRLTFPEPPVIDIAQQAAAGYIAPNVVAYNHLQSVSTAVPALRANESLMRSMTRLLEVERHFTLHETLGAVLQKLNSDVAQGTLSSGSTTPEVMVALQNALVAELSKRLPSELAVARASQIARSRMTLPTLMSALGDLSQVETSRALFGGDIRNVAPASLIGNYLSQAAAQGKNVSTFVGRFKMNPGSTQYGPERLFVSVDVSLVPLIMESILKNPNLLMHNHTPGQGTLQMLHRGMTATYAKYDSAISYYSANTILPVMTLSTYEGANVANYFSLGSAPNAGGRSKYPWSLHETRNGERRDYCLSGGYISCTHWIGEMPVGERIVTEYSTPGNNNDDPYGSVPHEPRVTDQRALRVSPIGTYTSFGSRSGTSDIGTATRTDRLTRMVWGQGAGHEQLWSRIGAPPESLRAGEFANPGWVAYSFLSQATADSVPVVFIIRQDATAPLDQAAIDQLASTISAR